MPGEILDELATMEDSITSDEEVIKDDSGENGKNGEGDNDNKDGAEDKNKDKDKDIDSKDTNDHDDHDEPEDGEGEGDVDDKNVKDTKDAESDGSDIDADPNKDHSDDSKDSIIIGLKSDIEELKKSIDKLVNPPANNSDPGPDKDNKDDQFKDDFKEESFLTDEDDIEDIIRDPEKFNSILNKVLSKGIEIGKQQIKTLNESMPNAIEENVNQINKLHKMTEEFYSTNNDLKPFKKAVSAIFETEVAKDPSKNYKDILKAVADETRKSLNLPAPSDKNPEDNKDKERGTPKLPKKGSQQRASAKSKPSPLISELDEMDKSLDL